MKESTGRESSEVEHDAAPDRADADSEATSKETLSDIEKNEEVGSSPSESDPEPSPDGALDESGEIKDAGPI